MIANNAELYINLTNITINMLYILLSLILNIFTYCSVRERCSETSIFFQNERFSPLDTITRLLISFIEQDILIVRYLRRRIWQLRFLDKCFHQFAL